MQAMDLVLLSFTQNWLLLQYLLPQALGAGAHDTLLPSRSTQLPLPLWLAQVPW